MRILMVEDDEHVAAAVKRGLEAEGYAVDVALDGTDGNAAITGATALARTAPSRKAVRPSAVPS